MCGISMAELSKTPSLSEYVEEKEDLCCDVQTG